MIITNKIGNEGLLDREKKLFLCSKHAPYSVYDNVFSWVDSLTSDDCVICFNSSELEEEVMRALLVNEVPTILVVMNRFTDKYNVQIDRALDEQRMLILVLQRDEPRGAGLTPRLRNEFVLKMADHVICGYVNKNGSIFPLLARVNDVVYLEEENKWMAGEPPTPPTHLRWKVWEDKVLLRMFYEDMGLHAIKKRLNRTYMNVRTRIRAITLPVDVLKGREFEDFVLELFDLNVTNAYSLIEWRGDKTTGEISPVSNCYPDFVLEYKEGKYKRIFSVECKWRERIPNRITTPLISPEQIVRYQEYSIEMNQDVFIVLGVGGEPSMPENLYVIPIDVFADVQAKPSLLKKYSRDKVDKWFAIEEFEHQ